ncbi:MAG: sulfite exporter TauE/SafE family protein [Acidobacteriia bacterium]|nr:sulfite exporter TauE/SafE family protein [Terriglobia bacterium]
MSYSEIALLFSAAVVGGAINSVAGGGGFIAFPALMFTGVPAINANATNTVALWPGTVASTGAYRKALSADLLKKITPLIIITVLGSLMGSLLLLKTRPATFDRMVPWLLLSATLLFAVGGRITAWMIRRQENREPTRLRVALITLAQACVAVYIGYFGAGVGIVMLALLSMMGVENIHAMNGLKTLLATFGNATAIVMFVIARAIFWPQAMLMVAGAVLGGYGGAYFAQKLSPGAVRGLVIGIGCTMTAYSFWKTWAM